MLMTTKRRLITIDIETLPASQIAECLLTDDRKKDEIHRKTALSGDFGRILCIGYTDERLDGTRRMGVIGWDKINKCLPVDEREILTRFWKLMEGFDPKRDHLIGHNIFDFDLRFIMKRSIILGVRPTVKLSFARYRSLPIFDTMCEWECWNLSSKISLDKLAAVLSLETSKTEEVNGSQIFELFQAGRHQEIRDYCLRDVHLTRKIYQMMTFSMAEEPVDYLAVESASMHLER